MRTGGIAFDHRFGMSAWEFYARNPENEKTFADAMTGVTGAVHEAVLAAHDFSPFAKMVDVGGGHGSFLAAVLGRNPRMKGVLFDAPTVADGARQRMEEAGLAARCEVVGGDFFQSVPSGGDLYFLKWIIHDWDDQRSVSILANCRRGMGEGGKLILVEAVVPPGNEFHFSKFMDMNMLVMTGGRERNAAEYGSLLEGAGFRLTRIISTDSPMSVIEGEPC